MQAGEAGAAGAGGLRQPASLLTRLLGRLPTSLSQTLGEGLLFQERPFSLLPFLPQQRFGGRWLGGRAQGLMLFNHMLSELEVL